MGSGVLPSQFLLGFFDLLLEKAVLASKLDVASFELYKTGVLFANEADHRLELIHKLGYGLLAGSWVPLKGFSSG